MTSNGRVARLTALALATGTLVAVGAGSAGAASTTKTTYTATGGGSVVRLTINLPIALPGIGQSLTQDLVLTGSNVRTGDIAAAVTSSILGANGNVPLVSGLLDKSVKAEYGKPQPTPVNAFPDLSALGITGQLLSLDSSANNPNVAGTVAHSVSKVANLRIDGAGNLQAVIDALTAQLTSLVNTAIGTPPGGAAAGGTGGTLAPVTNTITDLLTKVTDQLDTLTQNTTAPLSDAAKAAVQTLITQLNALPTTLMTNFKAATADTSLLSIKLIQSEQTVSRVANAVTSESTQALTGISVLGGLITVDGLTSGATATLGDGITKAVPTLGQNSLLHVNAANLLTADVTNGLFATLRSTVLPAQVTDAVNSVLAQVTTLLNGVLGATLSTPTVASNVATADKASTSVAAARLVVNPTLPGLNKPLFDKPLVDVQFVPSAAEVLKSQATVLPAVVTNPAKAASAPHALAQTGADLPLTGAVAAALMGLAAIARRRRAGGLAE
jgi:hypothetical protein